MHPVLRFFGIALALFMAAACWLWAYAAARQESAVTVVVALGVSLACLLSLHMMVRSTNVSPRGSFTSKGTLLQPDIRIDRSLYWLIVIGALSTGLCFLSWWPLGVLYVPLFREDAPQAIPFCAGAAAVAFLWLWLRYRMLGSLSVLLLSSEGFTFPTSASMREGRWEDVAEIGDRLPSGKEQFWNPMVFTMRDGSTFLFEAPGIYTPRGVALVEFVRFYWQYPQHRDELTDGRALQRLRRLHDEMSPEQR